MADGKENPRFWLRADHCPKDYAIIQMTYKPRGGPQESDGAYYCENQWDFGTAS
ncbi:hypothetical protein JG687_00016977 [Phytophthora cactorum]|uniref:Uncharacterized protein n=1 Tax=Phytophthora cactorum TaxID=29920 RepID=A0A329RLW8_9STRA|nr:hypothetical protein Pcac1_g27866 [Phytophthora cactorum]KAG2800344.1 hypothetical protein PC112_g20524 [Phytophthora cactorum]KAG2800696.1 hypothetical protein PC111_g19869 [Phytophthora cactorum]KAG2834280.1 hypothetical protein PC113_g20423 [Phytophthora cactorum]KAG2878195.1 hypothetical protein PC114_g23249 [Phytophthora cactorum]